MTHSYQIQTGQSMLAKTLVNLEEIMDLRILSGGAIGAIAGATMLAASSAPAPAFTLSSPSLEQPVAAAGVDSVYWRQWGGWHHGWHHGWAWGGGWHRWGGGWGPRYGFGPAYRCWWGPWGRRCGWV
jgi:hypothetical protein